jgi:flagellar hook-associated protein 2
VGLISGLNTQQIIDQLIAIEARPRDALTQRIAGLNAQKTAYLDISARITAVLGRISLLTSANAFRNAKATTSLPNVLSASATVGAQPGTYHFTVRSLAATHQLVSRGFDSRSAPLTTGLLTVESAAARVNNATNLTDLNGANGVRRGSFKIMNGTQQATINANDTLTVGDILDKINATDIGVTVSVQGDKLVLRNSGGESLRVQEVGDGHTAEDLGFDTGHSNSTTGTLTGDTIVYLSTASRLAALNDGLGIRHAIAGGDFVVEAGDTSFTVDMGDLLSSTTRLERLNHGQGVRLGRIKLTARDRTTAEVDLTGATSIGDIKQKLEAAFEGKRIAVVMNGSHLTISDNTDVTNLNSSQKSNFTIEDVTGHGAADLGIAGQSTSAAIVGRDILHMETLGDAVSAINYAVGNQDAAGQRLLTAAIGPDGQSLTLSRPDGGFTLKASSSGDSHALEDLGFQAGTHPYMGGGAVAVGTRILGGLNTVLLKTLNGGAGFSGSNLQVTANGRTATLDVSSARTLADVVDALNGARDAGGQSLGISAGYDATGTRLKVSNATDNTAITISGDLATSLGLAQTGSTIKSNNLQRQYIGETTPLADLNAGRGVAQGKFKITASSGASATVDLSATSITTLGDVIDEINGLNLGVRAGLNATGDGLLITDTAGGSGTLKIEEDGGQTAHDLNILGNASGGQIDGSYEFKLNIGGSDTLETLASRISSSTTLAQGTILNDGTPTTPYRLSVTALVSGARGALLIDDSEVNLGVATLTQAQDARLLYGPDANNGVLVTSSDNTFTDVVPGLTLTAASVSDQAVTVTVDRDLSTLLDTFSGLVDDYNSALDRMNAVTAYDADTETAGILQGESTLFTVQSRLRRMFTGVVATSGSITRLSQVGLKFSSGGHLSFDGDKFKTAYAQDPDAVQSFFADATNGVAVTMKKQVEAITTSGGLIEKRTRTFDSQKTLLQDRVTQLNDRLDRKRAQLERNFQAMESALAILQNQQQQITAMASQFKA